jgi:hypothetical protein
MVPIGVNLTLEQKVWRKFSILVSNRKKNKVINELLKKEIDKISRLNEENALNLAFKEASKDKKRLTAIREWGPLDAKGWGYRPISLH